MIAPSTACQVLQRLAPEADVPAYDLQAACSGYLYALAAGWDYLQQHPHAKVLVVTTETTRRFVDLNDPDTSPIFGDAATATVISTSEGHTQSGDASSPGSGRPRRKRYDALRAAPEGRCLCVHGRQTHLSGGDPAHE